MYRKLSRPFTFALTSGLLLSSIALAAPMPGAVTAIEKGMATIRTSDGKDHQVKAEESWKVGSKVECDTKDTKFECRPATPTAAVQPPAKPQQPVQPQAQQPAQPQTPAQSQVQQPAQPQKAN